MKSLIVSCKDETTAAIHSSLVTAGVLAEDISVSSGDNYNSADFDLVVFNLPLEGRFGLEEAAQTAQNEEAFVVVAATAKNIDKIIEKIGNMPVFLIAKPFTAAGLSLMLRNVVSGVTKTLAMRERLSKAEEKVNEIKLIDRAKFVLAEYLKLTAAEAHRYIQKNALDRRVKQVEIAKDILRTYEIV
jgi:response regulator NasT